MTLLSPACALLAVSTCRRYCPECRARASNPHVNISLLRLVDATGGPSATGWLNDTALHSISYHNSCEMAQQHRTLLHPVSIVFYGGWGLQTDSRQSCLVDVWCATGLDGQLLSEALWARGQTSGCFALLYPFLQVASQASSSNGSSWQQYAKPLPTASPAAAVALQHHSKDRLALNKPLAATAAAEASYKRSRTLLLHNHASIVGKATLAAVSVSC